ncbi:aldo/keto reductase [Desulfospira joergensenii]|uniref:aldo/keto reductase n=1 Tax=Desulfospira joergensenii TaxID=53329 RepID=UPI0003B51962|nr:aldo/keto reductase [Desulfospira joergensenii]
MLYRKMPKLKEELSVLGFGCMRLPVNKDRTIDEKRAIAQIRRAVDKGVNYIDTAWPYHGGKSEPLVGKALEEGYREKANIATKLPSWMVRDREHMDFFLNEQLKLLKTGQIDYYLIHNLAGPVWEDLMKKDILDFIDRAKADGRIRNAGFSFHGHIDDFKTIVDDYPWEFCQIQYNYLDEVHQAGTEGLKYAAARDLGIVIMEPLRGGNLGLPKPPPDVDKIWKQADPARTPVEWSLRWIWDHPEVTVVLSGMNEEAHIEENLKIAGQALPGSLTQKEKDLVKQASDTYKRLMKVGCTGCEYCKPCPEGVNISAAFEVFNKYHLFKNLEEAKFMYAARCGGIFSNTDPGWASSCIQCGECLEKCPQSIPIPDMLEEVVRDLEDDQLQNRLEQVKKMLNME